MTKEVFCKTIKTVNVSELVNEIHYADLMYTKSGHNYYTELKA